jgi:hypothetical protein
MGTLYLVLAFVLATPLAAAPSAAPTCSLLPSTDCTGGDIGNQHATTPQACCTLCATTPGCNAFSHNAMGPTCYFKSGCPTKAPAPSSTTAGVVPRTPPGSPCIGSITMTTEAAAAGEGGTDQQTTVYVMQSGGGTGTVELGADSITLHHGGLRVYLAKTCDAAFSPSSFEELSLLGKALSFSVDLSRAYECLAYECLAYECLRTSVCVRVFVSLRLITS